MSDTPLPPELKALQESENQYRRLVEMSPDLVLLCDEQGVILYVNLAGIEILGYERREELLGHKLEEIVAPDSRADVGERLRRLLGEIHELPFVEEVFLRADGKPIHVDMMGHPFVRDGDYVVHLVVRDVTRRKEAEATTRRLRRQWLAAAGVLVLGIVAAGGYHGYRYTESTRFCAQQCHSVMQPEAGLHARSAHAEVTCAQCHIGDGAAWYVKAKISGLHQVYAVLANTFHRPIPAPIVSLRPSAETCERCHSARVFHGNLLRVFRTVAEDGDAGNPKVTVVLVHLGGYRPESGRFAGIHWHASLGNRVEYRASDPRRISIPEVRIQGRTYVSGKPALNKDAPWRTMDCSDCHNRVPHDYESPETVVDRLLIGKRLSNSLPGIKKAALAVLQRDYPTRERAEAGILAGLLAWYPQVRPAEVQAAARVLYQDAYAPNVYPALKIGWNTYPNHAGHRDGLGCFRCHDGEHVAADGKVLSQDCDSCHAILAEGIRETEFRRILKQLLFAK